MSGTTYTIKFRNDRSDRGRYAFCTEKPIVDGVRSSPNTITNVWISKTIPDGSNIRITTSTEYYAWCGKLQGKPAPGVVIEEGNSSPVALGSTRNDGDELTVKCEAGMPFFDSDRQEAANAGNYAIVTGTDFRKDDNILIGLSQMDDRGDIVPVATILASPNTVTNIQPIVKFYVLEFDARRGTIVDWQSFSAQAGVIDFSRGEGNGRFTASVTHLENGLFDVRYE